ncbi:hypothetical protein Enr13x_39600 [Stieleria neptunia]|uniref:DUF6602 domain-containing protein n=1 Tax=Stieleria neptunia TaxID=2527979 RepID=A0A518HTA8_9BACT|nr:DUF6602 domain-containing protein [Stieleria neptunia]QDV44099.1 hypothetical protein Enr13x_39600 [Stieleria neptunia]
MTLSLCLRKLIQKPWQKIDRHAEFRVFRSATLLWRVANAGRVVDRDRAFHSEGWEWEGVMSKLRVFMRVPRQRRELGSIPPLEGQDSLLLWIDELAKVLQAEARLAGLLGHGAMVGNAREFFVQRVLRTVVPPRLHFGTGVIVDANGGRSKQIDVIVYDPDFPVMETQPGQGLYPIEGVICAIEVKSQIDKPKLHQAIENCYSVTSLSPFEGAGFRPSTAVFAYDTTVKGKEAFADHVSEWIDLKNVHLEDCNRLPEMIVAGSKLGLCRGGWFHNELAGQDRKKIDKASGKHAEILFAAWEVGNPFAWLLINLLLYCTVRASESHKAAFERYLPIRQLFDRDLDGREYCYHVAQWKNRPRADDVGE